jgi:hypothetical protein
MTNKLATLSGVNDISTTTVSISNCQCAAANIGSGASALSFPIASTRSFEVTFNVKRTDSCCVVTVESGNMYGNYNGTAWQFSHEVTGCASMDYSITAAGQIQYTSDALKGAGTMSFRARTIDF